MRQRQTGDASPDRPVSTRRVAALDVLNFALVDVNGAIKPYLNVFLYVHRGWNDALVGLVSTIAGLVGIAVQTPAGALVDVVADKRVPLLTALVILSIGPVLIALAPHFWPVLVASILIASVGGLLSPIVAALTIGLTAKRRLARQMGRNAAFERAGNVVIAISIGGIGWMLPDEAVFLLVPALCVIATAALFSIRRRDPDPADTPVHEAGTAPSAWRVMVSSRPLLVFALCAGLFHFANGPLLTLVAQNIADGHPRWSAAVISLCIVGAQVVMVPMAMLVGHRADRWGRKPLLVIAFVALPLRAILYTVWHDPFWLIGVQLIDGIGAGLLSAVKPLVLADIMAGTGRYNLALGIVGTMQGIGAALSFVIAGTLVQRAGFDAAYLACGMVALAALAVLVTMMPETRHATQEAA